MLSQVTLSIPVLISLITADIKLDAFVAFSKLHMAMNPYFRSLANSTEPLDQARPDSPTIPGFLAVPKLGDHDRQCHSTLLGQSEWTKAKARKYNDAKIATPRVDYGAVTCATALGSHSPTDDERGWSNDLRKQNQLRKQRAEAQAVTDLLKKDAMTKQKEMDLVLFGKVAGIPYKAPSFSKSLMMRVGASLKVFLS